MNSSKHVLKCFQCAVGPEEVTQVGHVEGGHLHPADPEGQMHSYKVFTVSFTKTH